MAYEKTTRASRRLRMVAKTTQVHLKHPQLTRVRKLADAAALGRLPLWGVCADQWPAIWRDTDRREVVVKTYREPTRAERLAYRVMNGGKK